MNDDGWERVASLALWQDVKTRLKRGKLSLEDALDHPVAQDRLVIELLCLAALAPSGGHRHDKACTAAERTIFLAGLDPDAIVGDLHPGGRTVLVSLSQGPDQLPVPA